MSEVVADPDAEAKQALVVKQPIQIGGWTHYTGANEKIGVYLGAKWQWGGVCTTRLKGFFIIGFSK